MTSVLCVASDTSTENKAMNTGRCLAEPCFVLHLRPYRDTSALVEFFSLVHGRFTAVVKGLRGNNKSRHKYRAALQPFNLVLVSWQGRNELKTVVDVQFQHTYPLLGRSLFCGIYINELLERLLHRQDPLPEIFHLYEECLQNLQRCDSEELILRRFEFSLLEQLGYGLNFSRTADNSEVVAGKDYYYQLERGLLPVIDRRVDDEHYAGAQLIELAEEHYSAASLRVAKRLTRRSLRHLLGVEPLRSRELFISGVSK